MRNTLILFFAASIIFSCGCLQNRDGATKNSSIKNAAEVRIIEHSTTTTIQATTPPGNRTIEELAKEGLIDEAIAQAILEARNDPSAPARLNNVGALLWKQHRWEDANKIFSSILDLDPANADVWYNKGLALEMLGNYSGALHAYGKAAEYNPKDPEAWYGKGTMSARLERYSDAVAAYDRAIGLRPDYAKAWHGRGLALAAQKDYAAAVESYERASLLNPADDNVWFNRGNSLAALGNYSAAVKAYERAVYINPQHSGAWNNMGNSLAALGRYNESIAAYDRVLEINPDHADAKANRETASKKALVAPIATTINGSEQNTANNKKNQTKNV